MIRRYVALLFPLVIVFTTMAEAQAPKPGGFTVFISAPQRDGFFDTSKDIQDSIKDIKNVLAKEKNSPVTVTDVRDRADIVLTVVQRGVGAQSYGDRVSFKSYYGGTALENTPIVASTFWVSTVMQVGKYKKEFTGKYTNTDSGGSTQSFGAWRSCGDQIAKNLSSWVTANAGLIGRGAAPSTARGAVAAPAPARGAPKK